MINLDVLNSTRLAGHGAISVCSDHDNANNGIFRHGYRLERDCYTNIPSTVLGPTQARFLGIVHAAIYDAVNAIDRKHQVYAIESKAQLGASMEAAAATAAHDTLIKLFPVQQSALDTALAESLSKIPDGPAKRDGIAVGKESAEKTVAAHVNDGAMAKVPYTPGTSPDSWQSTPPTWLLPLSHSGAR
jgi:hypothetical protein